MWGRWPEHLGAGRRFEGGGWQERMVHGPVLTQRPKARPRAQVHCCPHAAHHRTTGAEPGRPHGPDQRAHSGMTRDRDLKPHWFLALVKPEYVKFYKPLIRFSHQKFIKNLNFIRFFSGTRPPITCLWLPSVFEEQPAKYSNLGKTPALHLKK